MAEYTKSLTYKRWNSMKQRCYNENGIDWKRYGGRGIKVCDRWLIFDNFLADMGFCPDHLTLDRINNDGNYEPDNCRWATRKQQNRNHSRNILFTIKNETKCLIEWTEDYDISYNTVQSRLNLGWDIEKALSEPIQKQKEKRSLEWKGETKSLIEWADDIGIPYRTLRSRLLQHNWPVEKALTTPGKNKRKAANQSVKWNGKTQTIFEWANEVGIPYGTLRWRILEAGWPVERALTEAVAK